MFSSTNRLRKTSEIQAIFATKKILSNEFYRLHFDFEGQNGPKFALVTSKKLGKATVRNKLRRQIREVLKGFVEPLPANLRLVVIVKNQAKQVESTLLQAKLKELVERIRF